MPHGPGRAIVGVVVVIGGGEERGLGGIGGGLGGGCRRGGLRRPGGSARRARRKARACTGARRRPAKSDEGRAEPVRRAHRLDPRGRRPISRTYVDGTTPSTSARKRARRGGDRVVPRRMSGLSTRASSRSSRSSSRAVGRDVLEVGELAWRARAASYSARGTAAARRAARAGRDASTAVEREHRAHGDMLRIAARCRAPRTFAWSFASTRGRNLFGSREPARGRAPRACRRRAAARGGVALHGDDRAVRRRHAVERARGVL